MEAYGRLQYGVSTSMVFSKIWESARALPETLLLSLLGASVKCTKIFDEKYSVKAKQYRCAPTWTVNATKAADEDVFYPFYPCSRTAEN